MPLVPDFSLPPRRARIFPVLLCFLFVWSGGLAQDAPGRSHKDTLPSRADSTLALPDSLVLPVMDRSRISTPLPDPKTYLKAPKPPGQGYPSLERQWLERRKKGKKGSR